MALIAAEHRRDTVIAPSGCGRYRGVQFKRSRVSFLPDVVIGPDVVMASWYIWYTHTRRQMYLLKRKYSLTVSLTQQDVAVGKLFLILCPCFPCEDMTEHTAKRYHTFNWNRFVFS